MFKKVLVTLACATFVAGSAFAADTKIGVVNPQKILSQSQTAVATQKKLQKYFKPREDEVNRLVRDFKNRAAKFEKDNAIMTESERLKQRNDLAESERDIARKQRALVEERNQRSNEEAQLILSQAVKIIQEIASSQGYDVIIQDPVWANPKTDITEQVINRLDKKAQK